jgi:hypothetical protein
MENSTTFGADPKAAKAVPANGVHESRANGTAADESRSQTMQRAEELADRLGEQVGHYVSAFGHSVLRWAARAREEAEDIWAEAQDLRERQRAAGDRPENAPPAKK